MPKTSVSVDPPDPPRKTPFVPTFNETNVRHLLRRTEFVDRQSRVNHLMTLGSMSAAVDDVMNVDRNPPTVAFPAPMPDWDRGVLLAEFWLDRMAFAPGPFGERLALFWHGHICSDFPKAYGAQYMRDQTEPRSCGRIPVLQVVA